MSTLALCGGTVVTGLRPLACHEADVLVADGRIAAVGAVPAGAPRRDCSGTLLLPGLVCAHTHLYSALARGMPYRLAPPANFLQILQRVWWRLDRALDEPLIRLSALAGGLDALLAGTTTVFDHHASPSCIDGSLDVIAGALSELGLRSVLCYEVSDRDGKDRAAAGLAENIRFARRPGPLTRGLIGAHASFTLSDATLDACAGAAADTGTGVHIHLAEDAADQRDSMTAHGMRAAERLRRHGIVTSRSVLAHCVHIDERERHLLLRSGALIAHNARSNMNNGVGYCGLAAADADRVGLGTDGIGGDMITESQTAFFAARQANLGVPPDWPLQRLAAGSGAAGQVFGEPLLGQLAVGAPADITVVEYPAPAPLTAASLPGHWVFGMSPRQVRDVIVAGELVVADRRHTRVDQAQIAAQAAAQAARLWSLMDAIGPHEFTPTGGDDR